MLLCAIKCLLCLPPSPVWCLVEGLVAAVLSDTLTLTLTAPRSTAAELRFCSTRYQVCLNFQLELVDCTSDSFIQVLEI
jgi:hypothetical protein